jgi:hypothetical protein
MINGITNCPNSTDIFMSSDISFNCQILLLQVDEPTDIGVRAQILALVPFIYGNEIISQFVC